MAEVEAKNPLRMSRDREPRLDRGGAASVHWFVWAVSLFGSILFAYLAVTIDWDAAIFLPASFWLFATLAVIGELFPITVTRDGEIEEIGTSTTFGFAVLLAFGAAPAVLVFAVASTVADFVYRKRPWKVLFNTAQYTLSAGAAGAVYGLFGSPHHMTLGTLGPIVASAATFFVVNNTLIGIALAMAQRQRVLRYILSDLLFQASTAAALFAMSPIVLVVADRSPFLVPLLVVPVVAAYWGATASLENSRLIRRLEDALEHEKELSRLKDDFVAVVSHELRTPLTSIQGYLKTLLQLGDDLGEEQRRSFLEAADRQSDRLRRLIEQLLVVSRLESHVEPFTVSYVSMGQVVRQVVEELRPMAHGHTFDLRFDPGLKLVQTDEAKVHQILSNLIENALKYSPPDTRVAVRGSEHDGGVLASVEDEGRGIPKDSQDRVFDRFYQVDGSATRSVGGTGLGLYICKKMTEAIAGRLWLEHSSGEGTVFCLWVPEAPPDSPVTQPEGRPARSEPRVPVLSR